MSSISPSLRKAGLRARTRTLGTWPGILPVVLGTLALGLAVGWLPLSKVIPLLLVTAVVVLTVIQPLFGLGLTLLLGPLGALENILLGSGSFDSGQALLLLTIAVWLSRGLINKRFDLPRLALTGPLLLFIFITLLTLPGARDLGLGLKEVAKWVEVTVVMILVVDLGRGAPATGTGWRTSWIVTMLLLAGLSQALIGIWQFGLRGEGPEHFLVLDRFYRASGTFEQPNPFGGFMNMTSLLAAGLVIGLLSAWWLRRRATSAPDWTIGAKDLLVFLAASLVFVLSTLALLFSWSRGAWLGFAAGVTVVIAFWPRKLNWAPIEMLALLALFLLAFNAELLPTAFVDRISGFADDFTLGDVRGMDINDANYSVLEREAHWQAALGMTRDNLWTGVGFGNYGAVYADYDLINWPDALGHAHNYYLNLLAETGIVGLAAYLLLWTAVIWQTFHVLRRASWPGRGLALGLLAVWTAIAVHSLVDKLYVNNLYIHLGVLFGLLELLGLQVDAAVTTSENTAEGNA